MDNLQELFDCMMSFTPAQVQMYEMHDRVCKKYYDKIDPQSGMFPAGYYEDMRVIAQTYRVKFVDPRGTHWRNAAREGTVTVH